MGTISGKLYKNQRDPKINPNVVVTSGEYKGMKGRVCHINKDIFNVELMALNKKVDISRNQLKEIDDPTKSLRT